MGASEINGESLHSRCSSSQVSGGVQPVVGASLCSRNDCFQTARHRIHLDAITSDQEKQGSPCRRCWIAYELPQGVGEGTSRNQCKPAIGTRTNFGRYASA